MTKSRLANIFSMVVGIAALAGSFANVLPPKYAMPVMAVAAAVSAFNERIQGGASDPHTAAKAQAEVKPEVTNH